MTNNNAVSLALKHRWDTQYEPNVNEKRFNLLSEKIKLFNTSRWVSFSKCFQARFPNAKADFVVAQSSICYWRPSKKIRSWFRREFVVGDSRNWKCLGKGNVKSTYACLVADGGIPECFDKQCKALDVVIDTKVILIKIFNTANDICHRSFQYKMSYILIPTVLFQLKRVDSPYCAFCKNAEETILHMFWECPNVQDCLLEVHAWLLKQ